VEGLSSRKLKSGDGDLLRLRVSAAWLDLESPALLVKQELPRDVEGISSRKLKSGDGDLLRLADSAASLDREPPDLLVKQELP